MVSLATQSIVPINPDMDTEDTLRPRGTATLTAIVSPPSTRQPDTPLTMVEADITIIALLEAGNDSTQDNYPNRKQRSGDGTLFIVYLCFDTA